MSYKFLLFTLILSPMVYGKQMSIPVVTIVPVANLATEPSSKRFPNDPNPYDKLGTTYKSGIDSCPRLHQLLFNEQVRIIEQNGNDVLIEVPYLYFQTSPKGHKINRYWTDKRYFRPLKAIPQSQSCIPKPIDFNQLTTDHNNITTLTKPFYHCPSNTTYSAGTRFITTKHTSRGDSVLIYDPTTKQTHKNKQKKDPKGHRNAEAQSTTKYTQRPLGKLAVLLCGPAKQQNLCISQYYHTTT
mgnify:CR=1 FL=1